MKEKIAGREALYIKMIAMRYSSLFISFTYVAKI